MRLARTFFTIGKIRLRNRRKTAGTGAAFRIAFVVFLTAAFASSGAWAKPAKGSVTKKTRQAESLQPAAPKVDSARVKRLYLDGEFDAAIAILEDNLKETRPYNHGDSVFILKHLGVMYAAQYDTREKGKYYMHRLLEVEPTAKIMDMYASDMIYMIFKNIQEEYEQSRMAVAGQRKPPRTNTVTAADERTDTSGTQDRKPARASRSSGNGRKWIWAGAAVATVAVGVGAYVMMNEEPSKPAENEVRF